MPNNRPYPSPHPSPRQGPTPPLTSPLHPLSLLAKELEARELVAAVDFSVSVVDAFAPAPVEGPDGPVWPGDPVAPLPRGVAAGVRSAHQRVILRPDAVTAHPWWWLLWPGERFKHEVVEPEVTCLLPVECVEEVARRVRNILILDRNA